jgi:hypothetical protein
MPMAKKKDFSKSDPILKVQIPAEIHRAIKCVAAERGITIRMVVTEAITTAYPDVVAKTQSRIREQASGQ